MDILSVPFNALLGFTLETVEGQEFACLIPERHHENHLGTVHAGVVFSLAEMASGQAMLREIELPKDKVLAVVRTASVKYRRPASGKMMAIGSIPPEAVEKFMASFREKGRAFATVQVTVQSEDADVLTAEFQWFVTQEISES